MNDLYSYSIPAILRGLSASKTIIQKSKAWVAENGMDESTFIQTRLYADMFPFIKQIQIVTDNAKGAVSRLSSTENPKFDDTEDSFDSLITRIEKTESFIKGVPESAYEHADLMQVVLPFMPTRYLTGRDYLQQFLLPNFYFHVTTAYDIARMQGVPIAKPDYMGELSMHDLD